MATHLVSVHHKTADIALFESIDGIVATKYWIGVYDKFLTHQSTEPPYTLIAGYFDCKETGITALQDMTGNEF